MTNNFHTSIPYAAPVASSVVNYRLGQLDEALTNLIGSGDNGFENLFLQEPTTADIFNDSIIVSSSNMDIDTQSAAATDDLINLSLESEGYILFLRSTSASRVITVKHMAVGGNIYNFSGEDIVLDDPRKTIILIRLGTVWANLNSPSKSFDASAPTTTKGDLIARDASSNNRLGIGDNETVLIADDSQTMGMRWGRRKTVTLTHDLANNTAGGGSSAGAWSTRPINTVLSDPDSLVSALGSNQFTLVSGVYRLIHGESHHLAATTNEVGRIRLYNATDAVSLIESANYRMLANQGVNMVLPPVVFTTDGTKEYEMDYILNTGRATNGLGIALNLGITERYAIIVLEKVG